MNNIEKQRISYTIESNYMPYAMSVIISRAIPEIDGFKPSHRKLLYTMYTMNLLRGSRTKSANVVGQTMKLNPHGDMAIYETLVRLTRGNDALLHPYIDSKGNFGKVTSRDMAFAASRYTEVKLHKICEEIFKDIDKNVVEFVDNYDATMLEPKLLPTTFPNILINPNRGVAVGMSCNFPSFNMKEICDYTIAKLSSTKKVNPMKYIKAPDFSTGGYIVRDDKTMKKILETGIGSIKIRAKYRIDKKNNILEIVEIPYTTTVEAIIDKISQLIKLGRIKEISDIRDETDLGGLKIAIDLKRGQDPEELMQKLYRFTTLEDTFSCLFNLLIDSRPIVLGLEEIVDEWINFRINCIKNYLLNHINELNKRIHLLEALKKVMLDIDRAIEIIRNTNEDVKVVANLMSEFDIDELQAEYVANIRLRNINKGYIIEKTDQLEKLIEDLNNSRIKLLSDDLIKEQMVDELKDIVGKYSQPRRSQIIEVSGEYIEEVEEIDDYNLKLFMTNDGYLKKISLISLRASGEQKLKDTDYIVKEIETSNLAEIIFLSNKFNAYKIMAHEVEDCKASEFGEYINNLFEMEDDEHILFMHATTDFSGSFLFGYENGKIAKVPVESYQTKTRRRKLVNAFSDKARCINMLHIQEEQGIILVRTDSKGNKNVLVCNTELVPERMTKSTQGIQVIRMSSNSFVSSFNLLTDYSFGNLKEYENDKIPSAGARINAVDHFNYPEL